MTRHLGRLSLIGAVLSWGIMMLTLVAGGLDPPPHLTSTLQMTNMVAVVLALAGLACGVVALVRGPQRIAAGLGTAIALVFLLSWTGFLFVFFQ